MRLKSLLALFLFPCIVSKAQVTMQTGAPSINIPLIQYADEASKLKLDISLSYTGGNGIKVDQKSTEVGLGWTLNTGGIVQRKKNGEPDDQKAITYSSPLQTNFSGSGVGFIPAGIFNQPATANNPLDNSIQKLAWTPLAYQPDVKYYDPNVHYDLEHDKFQYQFNNSSGEFIIGKNSHQTIEEEISGNKIYPIENTPTGNMAGSITGFYIIAENGIKYYYEKMLLNNILDFKHVNGCRQQISLNSITLPSYMIPNSPYASRLIYNALGTCGNYLNNSSNVDIYSPYRTGYKIADAWYVSKIENSETNDKIVFNYEKKSIFEAVGINASLTLTNILYNINGPTFATNNGLAIFEDIIDIEYQELNSIDLPNEKKIKFIYNNVRLDETGKKSLDFIEYYDSDKLIYKYSFEYNYFFRFSMLDAATLNNTLYHKSEIALSLKSISKIGSNGIVEPPTNFEYYTGIASTPWDIRFQKRGSFMKDIFGYYSGYYNDDVYITSSLGNSWYNWTRLKQYLATNPPYTQPTNDINIAQIAMLKSISNKYGGKSTYYYELNRALSNNIEILSGGVRVSEIKNYKNLTDYTAQKYIY